MAHSEHKFQRQLNRPRFADLEQRVEAAVHAAGAETAAQERILEQHPPCTRAAGQEGIESAAAKSDRRSISSGASTATGLNQPSGRQYPSCPSAEACARDPVIEVFLGVGTSTCGSVTRSRYTCFSLMPRDKL